MRLWEWCFVGLFALVCTDSCCVQDQNAVGRFISCLTSLHLVEGCNAPDVLYLKTRFHSSPQGQSSVRDLVVSTCTRRIGSAKGRKRGQTYTPPFRGQQCRRRSSWCAQTVYRPLLTEIKMGGASAILCTVSQPHYTSYQPCITEKKYRRFPHRAITLYVINAALLSILAPS